MELAGFSSLWNQNISSINSLFMDNSLGAYPACIVLGVQNKPLSRVYCTENIPPGVWREASGPKRVVLQSWPDTPAPMPIGEGWADFPHLWILAVTVCLRFNLQVVVRTNTDPSSKCSSLSQRGPSFDLIATWVLIKLVFSVGKQYCARACNSYFAIVVIFP